MTCAIVEQVVGSFPDRQSAGLKIERDVDAARETITIARSRYMGAEGPTKTRTASGRFDSYQLSAGSLRQNGAV